MKYQNMRGGRIVLQPIQVRGPAGVGFCTGQFVMVPLNLTYLANFVYNILSVYISSIYIVCC